MVRQSSMYGIVGNHEGWSLRLRCRSFSAENCGQSQLNMNLLLVPQQRPEKG